MRIWLHFLNYLPLNSRAAVTGIFFLLVIFFFCNEGKIWTSEKKYYFGGNKLKFGKCRCGTDGKSSKQPVLLDNSLPAGKGAADQILELLYFLMVQIAQRTNKPQDYCQFLPQFFLCGMSRVDSYLFTLWVGLPLSLFIFLTYANSGFPVFFLT